MKLVTRRNYHKGQAALRHYANLTYRSKCLNSVLNVTAVVAAFNQEKALVGAFSVIVQPVVEPMDRFIALLLPYRDTDTISDGVGSALMNAENMIDGSSK